MNRISLIIILGVLCCAGLPGYAEDDEQQESQDSCDAESAEACAEKEDDELERGFDPCLINASLPACQPDEEGGEPGTAERTSSEADEGGDSG